MKKDQIIRELANGGLIVATHPHPFANNSAPVSYRTHPSGRAVTPRQFARLVGDGQIKPQGDGLFGGSQTFCLRRQ